MTYKAIIYDPHAAKKIVGTVGKRELGVVFIERANEILLVTVEEEW